MAEKEIFGLPKVLINFKTLSTTAIQRSARGIVVLILKNEIEDTSKNYKIYDTTDIPEKGLRERNVDLIKKCLLGTPYKLLVYTLPTEEVQNAGTTQADILKELANIKWNYIASPQGTAEEQKELATWIKSQRVNKKKTFKAIVANVKEADDMGVINFTTDKIRTDNPSFADALSKAGGDREKVDSNITEYLTYNTAEYTARIAGILAGLPLDRSATYYALPEIIDCQSYEDIDENISKGELVLFDEGDDNGVKIGRACNSLHTFTTDIGQDFRYIKIIEAIDMITDDIRDTFKNYYIGKVINDYNHKMNLIAAIFVYFDGLKGNVLDASETAVNKVDIDVMANKNYATLKGRKVEDMSVQELRETNTGTQVFLVGTITPVNAMEDLTINFTL